MQQPSGIPGLRILAGLALLPLAATLASAADNPPTPAPPAKVSQAGFSFVIEPAPAWVAPAAEEPQTGAPAASTPMHYRVIDEQTLLQGNARERYRHVVRVIDRAEGLSTASQIEVQFDPSFEALAIHHLRVLREGKAVNRLDRKRVQLLQRETQLERRIYDGRVTASIVLDDVRVGDEIDFAFSVRGANPVFDGRYSEIVWMGAERGPVSLYQFRLLAPEARKIFVRQHASDVATHTRLLGSRREMVFRRKNLPQFTIEPGAPYSAFLSETLALSEYADWTEVRTWAEQLFVEPAQGSPSLDARAAAIRAESSDPAAHVLAALKFVQAEIRYLGTEVGLNTHRPAPPEQVVSQRYGDCKDKTLVLVALLRRLGVSASPVLVSTLQGAELDKLLPSPLAFDHVIARVDLGDQRYWLDATRPYQTGPLDQRQARGMVKGLVLSPEGAGQLAELPALGQELRFEVVDRFRVDAFTQDITLESRITYRGDVAEGIREALATSGVTDLAARVNEGLTRMHPKIKTREAPRVEESTRENALTLVQQFAIPELWRYDGKGALVGEFSFWSLPSILAIPNGESRRQAFAIPVYGRFLHHVYIDYAEDLSLQAPPPQRSQEQTPQLRVLRTFEAGPRSRHYLTELQLPAATVAPADWHAHQASVFKAFQVLGVIESVPAIPLAAHERVKNELASIEKDLRRGKIQARTARQVEARVRVVLLDHQLEGGRLSGSSRAQALAERGISLDVLDDPYAARANFDEALRLLPDDAPLLGDAAANALMTGDFARSIELADRSLSLRPGDLPTQRTRAEAQYLSGDFAAAHATLATMLQDQAAVRSGYPIILLELARSRLSAAAGGASASYSDGDLPSEWPRPLVDHVLGRLDEDELIDHARSDRQNPSAAERLCEAYFYLGQRKLVEGDTQAAAKLFRKAMDQGITEYFEHAAARLELTRLDRR